MSFIKNNCYGYCNQTSDCSNNHRIEKEELEHQILTTQGYYNRILFPKNTVETCQNKKSIQKSGKVAQRDLKNRQEKVNAFYQKKIADRIDSLYTVYTEAGKSGKFIDSPETLIVLGGQDIRDKNYARIELKNLRHFPKKNGCILKLDESSWNILVNDVAMLGAIHKLQNFGFWSQRADRTGKSNALSNMVRTEKDGTVIPSIDDDILWDHAQNRPRVAGRELIMLREAGYTAVRGHKDLGIYFVARNPEKASSLTLAQVCQAAETATLAELRAFSTTK